MKTPHLPAITLALALTCLPALAQLAPSPAVEALSPDAPRLPGVPNKSAPAAQMLRNPVALPDSTVGAVIELLNATLEEQKVPPMNVVVSPEVLNVNVPSITLQNVTATDVLNVVTRVAGLSLEPVPSDSGKVAAWIITKRNAGFGMGGTGAMVGRVGGGGFGGFDASVGGPGGDGELEFGLQEGATGGGGTVISGNDLTTADKPIPSSDRPGRKGSRKPSDPRILPGTGGTALQWVDPAAGTPAPAEIIRVLGIGKIYDEVAGEKERAEKEARLADMLQRLPEEQHLACSVRPYHELHVLVVKGSPEAVALVEQTVTAMKENAGIKKPTTTQALKPF